MNSNALESDAVVQLAEDFVSRHRRGEKVDVQEYVKQFPELASEVASYIEALLFMEKLGDKSNSKHRLKVEAPKEIGEYRILGEIGRGGMGVVYEAVQSSLNRVVALKLLPVTSKTEPAIKQRFLREARTAASLHHSHIVPVHGVGEQDGACYFVMQKIDGISFDRIFQHLRRSSRLASSTAQAHLDVSTAYSNLPSQPSPPEAILAEPITPQRMVNHWEAMQYPQRCREVARIGALIAEALAYAHEQGVVHRDVKPGNILVDHQRHPWLSDFGLAQVNDNLDLTSTGQIVGTLRYLPPERLKGTSGPAGDIYSLGATLYELIALQHVFATSDHAQLIQQIHTKEPASLISLNAQMPGDLNTIIMKCLAKAPEQRYASAQALADDLHRFLKNEPIQAKPLAWWQKAGRCAKRNPVVAGLSTAVALLLISGMLITTALWLRSEGYRADAIKQRDLAQQNLDDALQAVESFYLNLGENMLQGVPELKPFRQELLAEALKFYEAIKARHPDQSSVDDHLLQANRILTLAKVALGNGEENLAIVQKAYDLQKERQAKGDNRIKSKLEFIQAILGLSSELLNRGKPIEHYLKEAELELTKVPATKVEPRLLLEPQAVLHYQWSHHFSSQHDYEQAEKHILLSLDAVEKLIHLDNKPQRYKKLWRDYIGHYCTVALYQKKRIDQVVKYVMKAKATLKALETNHGYESGTDVARLDAVLARCYVGLGDYEKSDALFKQAKLDETEHVKKNPESLVYKMYLVTSHRTHGYSLLSRERTHEALIEFVAAEKLIKELVQKEKNIEMWNYSLATLQADMAQLTQRLKDSKETFRLFSEACQNYELTLKQSPESFTAEKRCNYAGGLHNLARLYRQRGQLDEAEARLRQTVEHQRLALEERPDYGRSHEYLGNHFTSLSGVLREQKKHGEALKSLEEYSQWPTKTYGNTMVGCRELCLLMKQVEGEQADQIKDRSKTLLFPLLEQAVKYKEFRKTHLDEAGWDVVRSEPAFIKVVEGLK
jgi:serine/threonine protein kinase